MKPILVLIAILILFFVSKSIYAQDIEDIMKQICGTESTSSAFCNSTTTFFPMENDTLRALVIFANYPDGSYDPITTNSNLIYMQYWPGTNNLHLQKPSWADSVICPTTTNVWNPSLTGLMKQGSNGKFWLIGEVYPNLVVLNNNHTYYSPANGKNIGWATEEIIDEVTPNVVWDNYDKFDPCDFDSDGNRREKDGRVDFIFIIFRFTISKTTDPSCYPCTYPEGYSGIAKLGGRSGKFGISDSVEITRQGKKIGADFGGFSRYSSGCIADMYFKWFIGVPQHEFAYHYGYGSGHNHGGLGSHNIQEGGIASAHDREHFGWTSGNIYQPTSNTTNINLRDYVTTGDYLKIARNGKTYYVENRRRLNYYSSNDFHSWRWTMNEPLMPVQADSGLYIYSDQFNTHHAYGRWNFDYCTGSPIRYKILKTPYINQFIPASVNRYSGSTIMNLFEQKVADVNCNTIYNQYNTLPIDVATYIGIKGDSNTCFDVDYNEVFSPWSNPGVSIGSSSDSLVIELDERHSDGSIDVNVYFTDLLQAEPSKPQFIKTARQYLSSPPDAFKTRLTWLKNLESDISNYCIYKGVVQGNNLDATNYQWLGVTSDTFYVDNSVLYVHGGGSGVCDRDPVKNVYRVTAIDLSEKESVLSDRDSMSGYSDPCGAIEEDLHISGNDIRLKNGLFQNFPNPFNPTTRINYTLEDEGHINISLYDVTGRLIANLVNEFKVSGNYYLDFDATKFNLSSGIYFCKICSLNFTQVRQMILIK